MKTLLLASALLAAHVCAFSQNFPIRKMSKPPETREKSIKSGSKDSISIETLKKLPPGFYDVAVSTSTSSTSTTDLFGKNYRAGVRGIRTGLKKDIADSKIKLNNAIKNGSDIETSKDQFNEEVDDAYIKAINGYSRVYESYTSKGPLLFPCRNRFLTRYYFTNETDRTVEALTNGSFSFNTAYQGGSLYTELIAGYLGIFRISFGGMVAKSEIKTLSAQEIEGMTNEELQTALEKIKKENEEKLTVQNILAGGGNAMLNIATPLLHYSTPRQDFIFVASPFGRLGLALPEIGTTSSDAEVNSQYGIQFDIWHDLLTTKNDQSFALFGKAMVSVFNNETYSKDLGIQNGFRYVELTAGLELNSRFRVALNFPFIYGKSRSSNDENIDAIDNINKELLKSTVEVTIIPFK